MYICGQIPTKNWQNQLKRTFRDMIIKYLIRTKATICSALKIDFFEDIKSLIEASDFNSIVNVVQSLVDVTQKR